VLISTIIILQAEKQLTQCADAIDSYEPQKGRNLGNSHHGWVVVFAKLVVSDARLLKRRSSPLPVAAILFYGFALGVQF
jgi:hypothetical protein